MVPEKKAGYQIYSGAVLFASDRVVLKVIPPLPSKELLYKQIEESEGSKSQLIFYSWRRDEIVEAIQLYCSRGIPLPNIFEDDLASIQGITPFQKECFEQTSRISHGETRSYAWLAGKVNKFAATRAVGGAMKANPFPILIPCHRVVSKNGEIGGYMGSKASDSWQIALKHALLELEQIYQQPSLFPVQVFGTQHEHFGFE